MNLTHKHSDLKNYVGLNSSSHLRILRSKGNTLVDPKKKYKKGKVNNFEVMLCTLD